MGDAWAYGRDATARTTTSAGFQNQLSVASTTDAAEYIVFAVMDYSRGAGTTVAGVRLTEDAVDISNECGSITTTYSGFAYMGVRTLTAAAHTFILQYHGDGTTTRCDVRNAAIFLIKKSLLPSVWYTQPADQNTVATSATDIVSLTWTAATGIHLILLSVELRSSIGGNLCTGLLADGSNTELQRQQGYSGGAVIVYQNHNCVLMDIPNLAAGSTTYKLRGFVSAGTGYFSKICILAILVPASFQYNENESTGTGQRAVISWTPISGHEIFCFESAQADAVSRIHQFRDDGAALNNHTAGAGVFTNESFAGLFKWTPTGAEIFDGYTTNGLAKSRIFAIDLNLLGEDEEDISLPPVAMHQTGAMPTIGAYLFPPLDWGDGQPPEAKLKVVTGKVVRSQTPYFVLHVEDKFGDVEARLREFDPITVWVQAYGKVKYFPYRILAWERLDSDIGPGKGILLEIYGQGWVSGLAAKRGLHSDKTFSGRELADGLINPTDGLITTYMPEVGVLGVRNTGVAPSTIFVKRTTRMSSVFSDWKAYASVSEDWAGFECFGEHQGEYGCPTFHFDRTAQQISPMHLVVGKTLFWRTGKTALDKVTYEDLEYGQYGASADQISMLEPETDQLVDSYGSENVNAGQALYSGSVVGAGQSFTPSKDMIAGWAKFWLKKVGAPTGNVVAKLYRATGAVGVNAIPSGSPLATSVPLSIATLTTSYLAYYFMFINPPILGINDPHVVTCEYSGGDASNCLYVGCDTSAPTHAGNYSHLTGAVWTEDATIDMTFWLYEADSTMGLAPSYQRIIDIGAAQAETIADAVVRGAGKLGKYHQARVPFSLDILDNSKICIHDPASILIYFAQVTSITYLIDYDSDDNMEAYAEVDLSGLSTGDTLL